MTEDRIHVGTDPVLTMGFVRVALFAVAAIGTVASVICACAVPANWPAATVVLWLVVILLVVNLLLGEITVKWGRS